MAAAVGDAGVTAAIVPEGAGKRHPLSREANALGLPRVTPSYLFELLSEQHARTLEQARLC